MFIVFEVVYVFWICILSFQKCIVLNNVVFWICVLCFGYMYHVLDKCIVLYIYVLCFRYMYCVSDTCIVI